jgi:hypothetical protein
MYIGRPIHFEDEKAQRENRFRFHLALVMFALLAIVGPIVLAKTLAMPPNGETLTFIGP